MSEKLSTEANAGLTQLEDVVCTACGCLCDDVRLQASDEGNWHAIDLPCELGQQWFSQPQNEAEAWASGKPVELAEAYAQAADLLGAAHAPLVAGLTGVSIEAQRLAVQLADTLAGYIDTAVGEADHASIESFQTRGASNASWGEVAQRADLVIFWRCDPTKTHPRHDERYSLEPSSEWLPKGRADRTVVTVGVDRSGLQADIEISLPDGSDLDALWMLRALIHENRFVPDGVSESLIALSEQMKEANYVALLYGSDLKQQGPMAIGGITALAQELHQHTRAVAMSLGTVGNAAGAENVLAWQTGYPAAVSFTRGYPRFGLNETTTPRLLAEHAVDAALVVDGTSLDGLSSNVPSVVLTSGVDASPEAGKIVIRTAPLGWRTGESVHRSDGPALPLRHDLGGDAPSAKTVLAEILQKLAK